MFGCLALNCIAHESAKAIQNMPIKMILMCHISIIYKGWWLQQGAKGYWN
jgi:hypothetical protein